MNVVNRLLSNRIGESAILPDDTQIELMHPVRPCYARLGSDCIELIIDSPGGSVECLSETIARRIFELRQCRPN